MKNAPGPATQLIDNCFAGKLTLCRHVDGAVGFEGAEPWSFEGQLRYWYAVRRPVFEWLDALSGFSSVSD